MIEIQHLTKVYGDHTAVQDLSCTIQKGCVYGFLGPNGAGKSTTMNIITGCLSSTSGRVLIDGYDVFSDSAQTKKRIGYMPEHPPLYMDMTPREYLGFVAKAKGVARSRRNDEFARVVEATQLQPMLDRLIKNLSKGYRQRVGMAQALLGDPEIMIFDEPTVGLDPKQIIEIRDLIRGLGREHTVLLSSHILPEVRSVCDHVLIISHGRLVASDTPEHLESLFSTQHCLSMLVRGQEEQVRGLLSGLPGLGDVSSRQLDDVCELSINVITDKDVRDQLCFTLAGNGVAILEMSQRQASLEDVFLALTDDSPIDEPSAAETDGAEEVI